MTILYIKNRKELFYTNILFSCRLKIVARNFFVCAYCPGIINAYEKLIINIKYCLGVGGWGGGGGRRLCKDEVFSSCRFFSVHFFHKLPGVQTVRMFLKRHCLLMHILVYFAQKGCIFVFHSHMDTYIDNV
jgi:hypothetical protein